MSKGKRPRKTKTRLKGLEQLTGEIALDKKTDLQTLQPRKVFQRGRLYSPAMIETALRRSRGMISRAARRLGCSDETVRKYIKRYPVLEQVLWEVREAMMDDVEDSLYRQAVEDKNTTAAIFLAKCFGRGRGYIDHPNINVNANLNAEGLSWLDIMKEVTPQLQSVKQKVIDVSAVEPTDESAEKVQ